MKLEFKAAKGCNSGVFLNTDEKPGDVGTNCYELNIADPLIPFPTGSLVKRMKVEGAGETDTWRSFEVGVVDEHVTVKLDGKPIVDYQSDAPTTGKFIGLQKRVGRIAFRNIRVRKLPKLPNPINCFAAAKNSSQAVHVSGWESYFASTCDTRMSSNSRIFPLTANPKSVFVGCAIPGDRNAPMFWSLTVTAI